MGRAVTLDEIKEDVRQRCDLPAYSTTTFITTAAVTRLVNTSLQAFYAMLMECYGDDYFVTKAALTTTANQDYTTLPTDFLKLTKLFWLRGTNDVVDVRRADASYLSNANITARAWTGFTPRFRLGQQTLLWMPIPSAAYTLELYYVQGQTDLSTGSDAFQAGPGWDEWVVLDVCRKVREREEADPSEFVALRGDVETRVRSQAPDRYEADGQAVRDVMGPRYSDGNQAIRDWLTRDL